MPFQFFEHGEASEATGQAGQVIYTVRYGALVVDSQGEETNADPKEQSQRIILAFRTQVADYGSYYTYGQGVDNDTAALLVSIVPSNVEGSGNRRWLIEAVYEGPPLGDEIRLQQTNNQSTRDPDAWWIEYEAFSVMVARPLLQANYVEGFTGGVAGKYTAGEKYWVMNSAYWTYDPPISHEVSLKGFRVTQRFKSFDWQQYDGNVNAINNLEWEFLPPGQTWNGDPGQMKIPPYFARCTAMDYRYISEHVFPHYEVNMEFLIEDAETRPKGWRLEVPDYGPSAKQEAGDPDGKGGTVSQQPAGSPENRRMDDTHGKTIHHSVPLDGNGQPVPKGNLPSGYTRITWAAYKEADFNFLTRGVHPLP